MFIRARFKSRRAFTLLEVMIATLIIGMLTMTLYRFLASNLNAIRISAELGDEREAMQSVVRLLETQLGSLPLGEPATLSGQPFQFQGLSNDEITWRCRPGPGLMTTSAVGEFRVTLTIQPIGERSRETELGLRRQPTKIGEVDDLQDFTRGGGDRKYNWLPLIRPMAALEVRYFDAFSNQWVEAWTDPNRRPNLVRIRLWKRTGDAPLEAVLPVPSANLPR
jgi:prepilin-type N-terminal cleavage/methylation domain-containing protein